MSAFRQETPVNLQEPRARLAEPGQPTVRNVSPLDEFDGFKSLVHVADGQVVAKAHHCVAGVFVGALQPHEVPHAAALHDGLERRRHYFRQAAAPVHDGSTVLIGLILDKALVVVLRFFRLSKNKAANQLRDRAASRE